MDYNAKTRIAIFTYANGRTLTVRDMSQEKAKIFLQRSAPEFERRDGCLTSVGGGFTRDDGNGG